MELKSKTAVVTGATGGIGSALCKRLNQEGVKLIMLSKNFDKLERIKEEFGEGHHYISYDFTQTQRLEQLVEDVVTKSPQVDMLFNVAGVGVYKNLEDVTLSEWEESFAINVTAPFFLTKLLLPYISKSERGIILNVGSGMGKTPQACRSVYCATKYALRGMTLSLSEEFAQSNVKFVHIALGSTLTEFGPMSLEDKERLNSEGKAYLTPDSVAEKFVEIIRSDQIQPEIEIYPQNYPESVGDHAG